MLGALLALATLVLVWLFGFGPLRKVSSKQAAAGPALAVVSADDWRARRPQVLAMLAEHVYGPMPAPVTPIVVARRRTGAAEAGGVSGVEQWGISLGPAGAFTIALVLPRVNAPAPTILAPAYCGLRAAFPNRPEAIAAARGRTHVLCRHPAFDPIARTIWGAHIHAPPFELIAARGYALALFHLGDVVPDETDEARAALDAFAPEETGAIAAWAWVYSRALDVLREDKRLDPNKMVAWGQSRTGKVALLAAATDERFAAVTAFQSGRGADALTRHRAGESVAHITRHYPHWFTPRFASYARENPPVDQHEFLALIAPRPLLLGHAARDAWSDPIGAREAAEAAAPVFAALGAPPPAFVMRDGTHGITLEDWRATLDFLDARL